MDLLKSIIGDVNPRELFDTMIKFMHQTVAHQHKMEAMLQDIQSRLTTLEEEANARVQDRSVL